jgi:hypothetical protein
VKFEIEPTKQSVIEFLLIINLVCVAALGITAYVNHSTSQHTFSNISHATKYVCNTTSILDTIVQTSIAQTSQNFKLHEYQKLEQAGVLTKHDIKQARVDLAILQSDDVKLHNNTDCDLKVSG